MLLDVEQQRVAAAREQTRERWLEGGGLEEERRHVPVQVIDGDERQPPRPGERLGSREPDEQRADQPGAGRDGDGVDVVERGPRLLERLADHRRDQLEMPARGDLRDDPPVFRVQFGLRGHDVGTNLTAGGDDSRGCLVTRGLDPEDHSGSASRHMISASSRLSV